MKKNKKNKTELQDDERLENPFEVFIRNYKNVPGFRIVCKLGVYVVFILFMLIVVAVNNDNDYSTYTSTSTTEAVSTEETVVVKYRDILESIVKDNVNVTADITIDNIDYNVTYEYNSGVMEGYLETVDNTKKFKVENNVITEIKLKEEIENPELFGSINLNYLINGNLVSLLESNTANKTIRDNETTYKYTIDNVKYVVGINNSENKIEKIEIAGENYTYTMTYEIGD